MNKRTLIVFLAASTLTLAACGKKEAPPPPPPPAAAAPAPAAAGVSVASVNLGKSIGADKKVAAATETFGPKDTIYASIDTTGAGSAAVKAKWTYTKGDKTVSVKEDSMQITPTGPATNEFHISKPDGWPVGDYAVEIVVNDKPAGSRKFSVK
jgi:hypothetical protein